MTEAIITYKGNSITEHDAIVAISKGAPLSDFNQCSRLMSLAAVTYRKDGYKEVKPEWWSKRLAKMAVEQDYHAILMTPDMFRSAAVRPFVEIKQSLDRQGYEDWKTVLNQLDPDTILTAVKLRTSVARDLTPENITPEIKSAADVGTWKKKKRSTPPPEDFKMPFQDILMEPEAEGEDVKYLALPQEEKTKERLQEVIESNAIFRQDFLKQLLMPNYNRRSYMTNGKTEQIKAVTAQILPFLTQSFCQEIADKHPEAAIEIPSLIRKEAVEAFFAKHDGEMNKKTKRYYLLHFPSACITADMIGEVPIDRELLRRLKDILAGTEKANKYLDRNPAEVLYLPGEYQNTYRILKDGVPLTKGTLPLIKDEVIRENIRLALNIS